MEPMRPLFIGRPLDGDAAERLATALRVVADPARLRLLSLIGGPGGRDAGVGDLAGPVGLTQPTVSHHLKVLLQAGLIRRERRGSRVVHGVVPEAVRELAAALGAPAARSPRPRPARPPAEPVVPPATSATTDVVVPVARPEAPRPGRPLPSSAR